MKTPQDIVTSYELARQLYKLGIVKDSIFWWVYDSAYPEINTPTIVVSEKRDYGAYQSLCPAPTSEELGILFKEVVIERTYDEYFSTFYYLEKNKQKQKDVNSEKLCDSMAKLLIELHNNKLI